MGLAMQARDLNAWFGDAHVLRGISLALPTRRVTAIIGPSGCGKSTFLRCLNRMHECARGARLTGEVYLGDWNIYGSAVDPVRVRRRIGMVFQKPNPLPALSIFDNVVAGLKLNGHRDRRRLAQVAERCLQQAALWDEVKDRLRHSPLSLSGGQQQRLCIARALAIEPEVLLLDEPTAALDPIATARIEELLIELKEQYTIAIVTHNMQQASRVSDYTAFFLGGELIEWGETATLFTNPAERKTEEYLTGRFG